MIKSIILKNLRNGEFIQFSADVIAVVLKHDQFNLKVEKQLKSFQQISTNLERIFKVSQGSLITKEIESMDLRRDAAISGIALLVQGYTYSTNEIKRKHAEQLNAHLQLFGPAIARDNYQSETASIRNILEDWNNKPELSAAIAELGLQDWRDELKSANDEFQRTYTARNEELAAASGDKIKELREEAMAAFYKLRDRINSHLDINEGAEPWAITVREINQTISNYNTLLARRGTSPEDENPATPLD